MVKEVSVTTRPNDDAEVTMRGRPFGSGMLQMYGWWVCPVTTRSISGCRFSAMSDDRPGDAVALLVSAGLEATLVQQHDDRLHAAPAQLAGGPVGGLDLVAELDALDAGLGDQGGRRLQGHPDVAHLDSANLLHRGAGQDRPAGALPDHVGGEPAEVGAGVAAVHPMARSSRRRRDSRRAACAATPQRPRRTRGCRRWRRSRPIAFSDSTAGSSWNSPDRNGEPPIRSPAATVWE